MVLGGGASSICVAESVVDEARSLKWASLSVGRAYMTFMPVIVISCKDASYACNNAIDNTVVHSDMHQPFIKRVLLVGSVIDQTCHATHDFYSRAKFAN